MRIPDDAIIADEKLTEYLLVQRLWDDKSGYLRRAGFVLGAWVQLRDAIFKHATATDAVEDGGNEYGTFYRVEGSIAGPTGSLRIVSIWMRRASNQRFYFVTLKPAKE